MDDLESVSINGVQIKIRPDSPDLAVARSCLLRGEFAATRDVVPEIGDGFIVDAGGYIGTAAIAFALMYPNATIVTIEPSPENFAILKLNVAQFPRIVAVNKALVGHNRSVMLQDRNRGPWGFTVVEGARGKGTVTPMTEVATTTVPDIMNEYQRSVIDVLKLDIEGAEKEVLEFAGAWIDSVRVLFAELHDGIVHGCMEAFDRATTGRYQVIVGHEKIASLHPDLHLSDVVRATLEARQSESHRLAKHR